VLVTVSTQGLAAVAAVMDTPVGAGTLLIQNEPFFMMNFAIVILLRLV
jgi:hypothetical protein